MEPKRSSPHRLTKIVATLGPACSTPEQIEALFAAGVNVARINVSHGDRPSHEALIQSIRSIQNEKDYHTAIMLDTRGAEIRTGDVTEPIEISAGEEVIFAPSSTFDARKTTQKTIYVGYDAFQSDVKETNRILVDNGELSFTILGFEADGAVRAQADQAGSIGSRRHINLPGADIDLPSITDKDWKDIAFAAEQKLNFVALSFIRTAEEITKVREFLADKPHAPGLIVKVETQKAVENIQEIIQAADGIMVARGDLGAEIPFEDVPLIQQEIILSCRAVGKPVIVATHMLESMREHPIPTRAEVTDVAHAALQGTDATMLSGETATGKHPAVAVSAMDRILRASEQQLTPVPGLCTAENSAEAYAESAVSLAQRVHATAIIVFTKSGKTAQRVSKFRPNIPVITCSDNLAALQSCALFYGLYPLELPLQKVEETIEDALAAANKKGLVHPQDVVVLLSDTATSTHVVPSLQVRQVET